MCAWGRGVKERVLCALIKATKSTYEPYPPTPSLNPANPLSFPIHTGFLLPPRPRRPPHARRRRRRLLRRPRARVPPRRASGASIVHPPSSVFSFLLDVSRFTPPRKPFTISNWKRIIPPPPPPQDGLRPLAAGGAGDQPQSPSRHGLLHRASTLGPRPIVTVVAPHEGQVRRARCVKLTGSIGLRGMCFVV